MTKDSPIHCEKHGGIAFVRDCVDPSHAPSPPVPPAPPVERDGDDYSTEPNYQDIDGNPCSLDQLCEREPAWAANRIRVMREQLRSRPAAKGKARWVKCTKGDAATFPDEGVRVLVTIDPRPGGSTSRPFVAIAHWSPGEYPHWVASSSWQPECVPQWQSLPTIEQHEPPAVPAGAVDEREARRDEAERLLKRIVEAREFVEPLETSVRRWEKQFDARKGTP